MQTPKLLMRKSMLDIQGRMRPCVQIMAKVDPEMQALLKKHFFNDNLFKRTSYAQGFPQGAPVPAPSLAPHLNNFIRNDACPEISVKTMLTGQMHQASTIWEMKAFEYVAERAFDSLLDLMRTAAQLGQETSYAPEGLDAADFEIYTPPAPAPAAAEAEGDADAGPAEQSAEVQPAAA